MLYDMQSVQMGYKVKILFRSPDPDRFVIVLMGSNPVTCGWQRDLCNFTNTPVEILE